MEVDVIVVGSGVAGAVTAHYLARHGLSVGLISKTPDPSESNTLYAQGGIVYKGQDDSPELIYEDIMKAGAKISNPEAAKIVSQEGDTAVNEILINEFGINFTKDPEGNFDLTEEGAHSARRILHSFDATGRSIEEGAIRKLKKNKNIVFLSDYTAVDIITWDHHTSDRLKMYQPLTSLGVYALNNRTRHVEKILSKAVVVATGGMGQIFLHTTNPAIATGDGYAMARRAGARLIHMEYTQFHPTTLYHPKAENFLISEAVRGEGAIILDYRGRAFMEKYHPLKDLAPRDVVTRAILNEMLESGEKFVYLDLKSIGKDKIPKRFPNIYKKCLDFGLDITDELVPIVPAFHFSCGGILTDMNGRSTIDRLYSVGEAACNGLHGANRLASTSLLEGVVFGKRAAQDILNRWDSWKNFQFPPVQEWIDTGISESPDPALLNQDWNLLKNIMWNYVGAIRTTKRLRRALTDLTNLKEDIEDFYRDTKLTRPLVELRNAVQTGLLVAKQALANRESIGTHYRID